MSTFLYQVSQKHYLTAHHLQLLLQPQNEILNYQAGQYLTLRYPDGEFMPFSIANTPTTNGTIELHIKISPTDMATQLFTNQIETDSVVTISGPLGNAHLNHSSDNLILIAAGTGFSAAKAVVERLIEIQPSRECHLYWTVKGPQDFYLMKVVEEWQEKLTNFRFSPICSETATLKILEQFISDYSDLKKYQVYVFGPYLLAQKAQQITINRGILHSNFFTDML